MSAPYKDALDRLAELASDLARIVYDQQLNTLLDPLRRYGPIRVLCRNRSCGQTVSWWALDQQIAIVLSAKRRLTKRESKGLGGPYELRDDDLHSIHGFGLPEREAADPIQPGRKKVTLADNPGHGVTGVPTRRTFACGKCGQQQPSKNETMLRLFLGAASRGREEIRF